MSASSVSPPSAAVLVAESLRVREGAACGLDLHRDRFLSSAELHLGRTTAERGWLDGLSEVPREGDWFPRWEVRADDPRVHLLLRPTPATATEVVVATAPHDPRTAPLTKGPDLAALQRLRDAVAPLGAGEAIIVDAHGTLIEGAYSALLVLDPARQGAVGAPLVVERVPSAVPRIPSVTERLVVAAVESSGGSVVDRARRGADLEGCELWVLSALHGVRLATAWVPGSDATVPQLAAGSVAQARVAHVRALLDATARPLPFT